MKKVFENQLFEGVFDRDSGRVFADADFYRCQFQSSRLSITRDPKLRSIIRNVSIVKCEQRGCALEAAIVEDVLIDGLKTNGLFQTWAAVFNHVTLRGKIDRIMMSPAVATGLATPAEQRAFDDANAAFYETVDWALDIREGEFDECEIQRVPARLVLRDPESQVVVTREKAMQGRWREIDLSNTYWATSLEFFLERGDADLVLVAPKRHRKYRSLLDGLKALRNAGVAESD